MKWVRQLVQLTVPGAAACVVATFLLAGCSGGGAVDRLADGSDGRDWAGYGRTNGQQHFSPLTEIDQSNVKSLGLAWSLDLPPVNTVTEPIAVDGVLYFATGLSVVRAVDARTGTQVWEYDPNVGDLAGLNMRAGWGVRGIAWWNGKVYVGTQDGRLIAVDAKSGKPVWTAQTYGPDQPSYISGAPRVFGGRVLIGFGGTVGAVRGYVTAYDAETGKQLWRFWTVPGDPAKGFENKAMEMAAKTWSGEWWKAGGGGTVWNAMAWDSDTDTVYIGTGSPYPWNHRVRSKDEGDNLFAVSILALDAQTGAYKWHYQLNPGDTWDFDATMDMALADIEIGGRTRKVLMQAPKNGFFYVLDRISGELISAEPFVETSWATHVDKRTGRPVEVEGARFPPGTSATITPSSMGAHNWMAMAYSPGTRLAYIPVQHVEARYSQLPGEWRAPADRTFSGAQMIAGGPDMGTRQASGSLLAWSPERQKAVWSVPYPTMLNGGVLATGGGLVFQGAVDGHLRAFSATTGKPLWQFDARAPIMSALISYEAGGRQQITVITGSGTANANFINPMSGGQLERYISDPRGQARRVLTFSLGAKASLPARPVDGPVPEDNGYVPDPATEQVGMMGYMMHCSSCHSIDAVAVATAPDLRRSVLLTNKVMFSQVVQDGAMRATGMPAFPELGEATLEAIRQYLRARAKSLRSPGEEISSPGKLPRGGGI